MKITASEKIIEYKAPCFKSSANLAVINAGFSTEMLWLG